MALYRYFFIFVLMNPQVFKADLSNSPERSQQWLNEFMTGVFLPGHFLFACELSVSKLVTIIENSENLN
jgi:hypothetical protein